MSKIGFHRHSLSLKLGVTITAFIALLFVSSVGLLYIRSRQLVKQEALERAEKALDKTALRVSCYLSEIEAVTENLKWIVNQDQTPDSLLAYTRRIVALSTNIDGCSITMEPDFYPPSVGRFSAYTVRKGDSIITQREGDYDYYSKVWYRTPKEQQRPCWINPFNDYNTGTLSNDDIIVSYCIPLIDKTGRFIGVISTDLSMTWLLETIEEDKPYPHSYCIILQRDDSLPDISGEPCYVFQKIVHQTGWRISLICPERDSLDGYKKLGYIIFTVLIIGLILLLIFFMRTITRFVSPLNQLVSQSQYIASGHFGEPMARTRRTDLVGQLQNSFSTMQESLAEQIGTGVPTLRDIISELTKPGRDPRDELPPPLLRTDVLDMKDLKPGMELKGTVRNVIDFGAFVDIGVHQDGLVHISQISQKRIKHPSEVLMVGDIVTVRVLNVDVETGRISLTMKEV